MKKLVVILSALVALVLMGARVAGAGVTPESPAEPRIVEESSDGSLRLSSPETWTRTNVRVSDDVLVYGDAWKEAYTKPGTVVPVRMRDNEYISREGMFHARITPVVDIGITRDETGIHVVRDVRLLPRVSLLAYPVLWVLSAAAVLGAILFSLAYQISLRAEKKEKVRLIVLFAFYLCGAIAIIATLILSLASLAFPWPFFVSALVSFMGCGTAVVLWYSAAIDSYWNKKREVKITRRRVYVGSVIAYTVSMAIGVLLHLSMST